MDEDINEQRIDKARYILNLILMIIIDMKKLCQRKGCEGKRDCFVCIVHEEDINAATRAKARSWCGRGMAFIPASPSCEQLSITQIMHTNINSNSFSSIHKKDN